MLFLTVKGKQKAKETFTVSSDNIVKQKHNKLTVKKRLMKIKIDE